MVYEPLGSIVGHDYYHEPVLYADSAGEKYLATSYASTIPANPGISALSQANTAATSGSGSDFGVLQTETAKVSDLSAAEQAHWLGTASNPYDRQVVTSGQDFLLRVSDAANSSRYVAIDRVRGRRTRGDRHRLRADGKYHALRTLCADARTAKSKRRSVRPKTRRDLAAGFFDKKVPLHSCVAANRCLAMRDGRNHHRRRSGATHGRRKMGTPFPRDDETLVKSGSTAFFRSRNRAR